MLIWYAVPSEANWTPPAGPPARVVVVVPVGVMWVMWVVYPVASLPVVVVW